MADIKNRTHDLFKKGEERTLASIYVSAGEDDGLGTMKPETTRGVLADANRQQPP